MGYSSKKTIRLSVILLVLLSSTLVLQSNGFNVIRSRSLDSISPVNNNTILEDLEEHLENGGNATTPTSYPMCRVDAIEEHVPVDIDLSRKFPTLRFNVSFYLISIPSEKPIGKVKVHIPYFIN